MIETLRQAILDRALSAIDIYFNERHYNYGRQNVWKTPVGYTVLNYDFNRDGAIWFHIMVHIHGEPTDNDVIVSALYDIESDTIGIH